MLILGLDPGIAKFGYGYVLHSGGSVSFVDAGTITTSPETETAERLAEISTAIQDLLSKQKPDAVVIERLIPGPNRNLGRVFEARGVALSLVGLHNIPISEESPKAVKSLTTRHGSATKQQMRKTVQRLLNMKELPLPDAADALAMAILGRGSFIEKILNYPSSLS